MSSISDVIFHDHRELEQFYNEVVNSTDNDHRQRYGNQFTWELARHSVGEELVVYPAFETYLGDEGHKMAEKDRKEHHQVKEQLKKFQQMKAGDPEYNSTLKSIMDDLGQHIKEEESHDFPALEEKLKAHAGASESLATTFQRTKMFIPTRSHPSAGENPAFESVMGLLSAPIDRLSDMFRKFPKEQDPERAEIQEDEDCIICMNPLRYEVINGSVNQQRS